MSRDNFDNEIAQLYQQRKHKLVAPQIKLKEQSYQNKYSPLKLLTLFLAGGMASFGIMAVISHLSTNKTTTISPVINSQAVELIEPVTSNPTDKTLVKIIPLPEKPQINVPLSPALQPTQGKPQNHDMQVPELTVNLIKVLTLPQLTEPKLVIEPIYKVLPKYSLSARNSNQVGEVKLSYHVDSAGKVKNINIVSSSVNRDIQRSTKKALSQWLYTPNEALSGNHEVVFVFSIAKDL